MEKKRPPKIRSKWHSVMVLVQTSSCAAATLCRNVRFLAGEAPLLPLSECDRAHKCQCTYRHLEDRRAGVRRSADIGINGDRPPQERRGTRGRRASDKR